MAPGPAVKQEMAKLVSAEVLVERASLHDLIERRAYEMFKRRGCVQGSDVSDWVSAESEVLFPCRHELKDLPDRLFPLAGMPSSFTASELDLVRQR
jgi:hypothetical protein